MSSKGANRLLSERARFEERRKAQAMRHEMFDSGGKEEPHQKMPVFPEPMRVQPMNDDNISTMIQKTLGPFDNVKTHLASSKDQRYLLGVPKQPNTPGILPPGYVLPPGTAPGGPPPPPPPNSVQLATGHLASSAFVPFVSSHPLQQAHQPLAKPRRAAAEEKPGRNGDKKLAARGGAGSQSQAGRPGGGKPAKAVAPAAEVEPAPAGRPLAKKEFQPFPGLTRGVANSGYDTSKMAAGGKPASANAAAPASSTSTFNGLVHPEEVGRQAMAVTESDGGRQAASGQEDRREGHSRHSLSPKKSLKKLSLASKDSKQSMEVKSDQGGAKTKVDNILMEMTQNVLGSPLTDIRTPLDNDRSWFKFPPPPPPLTQAPPLFLSPPSTLPSSTEAKKQPSLSQTTDINSEQSMVIDNVGDEELLTSDLKLSDSEDEQQKTGTSDGSPHTMNAVQPGSGQRQQPQRPTTSMSTSEASSESEDETSSGSDSDSGESSSSDDEPAALPSPPVMKQADNDWSIGNLMRHIKPPTVHSGKPKSGGGSRPDRYAHSPRASDYNSAGVGPVQDSFHSAATAPGHGPEQHRTSKGGGSGPVKNGHSPRVKAGGAGLPQPPPSHPATVPHSPVKSGGSKKPSKKAAAGGSSEGGVAFDHLSSLLDRKEEKPAGKAGRQNSRETSKGKGGAASAAAAKGKAEKKAAKVQASAGAPSSGRGKGGGRSANPASRKSKEFISDDSDDEEERINSLLAAVINKSPSKASAAPGQAKSAAKSGQPPRGVGRPKAADKVKGQAKAAAADLDRFSLPSTKDIGPPEAVLSPLRGGDLAAAPKTNGDSSCIRYNNGVPSLFVRLDLKMIGNVRLPDTKASLKAAAAAAAANHADGNGSRSVLDAAIKGSAKTTSTASKVQKRKQESTQPKESRGSKTSAETTKKIKKETDTISRLHESGAFSGGYIKKEPESQQQQPDHHRPSPFTKSPEKQQQQQQQQHSSPYNIGLVQGSATSSPVKRKRREEDAGGSQSKKYSGGEGDERSSSGSSVKRKLAVEPPNGSSVAVGNGHLDPGGVAEMEARHWHLPLPPHPKREIEDKLYNADFYLNRGKDLKHQAEALSVSEKHVGTKAMTYLEAILDFILCGYCMERDANCRDGSCFKMYSDTMGILRFILKRSWRDEGSFEKKMAVLCLRVQALLYAKLFRMKRESANKSSQILGEHFRQPPTSQTGGGSSSQPQSTPAQEPSPYHQAPPSWRTRTPSPASPTPSPAGSVGSASSLGSNGDTPGHGNRLANGGVGYGGVISSTNVSIPQRIHTSMQSYYNATNYMLSSYEKWEQADNMVQSNPEFFESLDRESGGSPLSLHSSILDLVYYVRLGLQRLKK